MTALEKVSNEVESKLKNIIQEYLDSLDRETEKKFHSDYETFEEVSNVIYEKIFESEEVQGVGEDNIREIVNNLPYGIVRNVANEFDLDLSIINNSLLYRAVRTYLATQMLNDVLNEFV